MSASESKEATTPPLAEQENAPTNMTFDKGGVPFYVALIWVGFLVSYVIYMVIYGLPDLSAWGAP